MGSCMWLLIFLTLCPGINKLRSFLGSMEGALRSMCSPYPAEFKKRIIRPIRNRKPTCLPHIDLLFSYQHGKCLLKQSNLQSVQFLPKIIFDTQSWVDTLSYLIFWKLYCQTQENIQSNSKYHRGLEQNHVELQMPLSLKNNLSSNSL